MVKGRPIGRSRATPGGCDQCSLPKNQGEHSPWTHPIRPPRRTAERAILPLCPLIPVALQKPEEKLNGVLLRNVNVYIGK